MGSGRIGMTLSPSMTSLEQADIEEAWRGFRSRLQRRGMSRFLERNGEDLFAQALLELSQAMAERKPIRSPVGWLINCSWRRTQNLLAQESCRAPSVSAEALQSLTSNEPSPEEQILDGEGLLAKGIRFLPLAEQALIELIYVGGMSRSKAGQMIGWGNSKADRHHRAALHRLRVVLTKRPDKA
jgi:DNA-directed RNA polymerase specialized sigma24 family protein